MIFFGFQGELKKKGNFEWEKQ